MAYNIIWKTSYVSIAYLKITLREKIIYIQQVALKLQLKWKINHALICL